MKKVIIAAALLMTGSAFANSLDYVYQPGSILPQALKVQVLETLKKDCALGVSNWGLNEQSSRLISQFQNEDYRIDHYVTEFRSQYSYDGYHPSVQTIVVESDLMAPNDGSGAEVTVRIVQGQCDGSGR